MRLADAVGARAEDQDRGTLPGLDLGLLVVGGVVVRRAGGELRGAGVDRLVDGVDAQRLAHALDHVTAAAAERADSVIGEAVALGQREQVRVEHLRAADLGRRFSATISIWSRNRQRSIAVASTSRSRVSAGSRIPSAADHRMREIVTSRSAVGVRTWSSSSVTSAAEGGASR